MIYCLLLQELARRVSMSNAMQHWNDLNIQIKQLEKHMHGLTGEAKEVNKYAAVIALTQ